MHLGSIQFRIDRDIDGDRDIDTDPDEPGQTPAFLGGPKPRLLAVVDDCPHRGWSNPPPVFRRLVGRRSRRSRRAELSLRPCAFASFCLNITQRRKVARKARLVRAQLVHRTGPLQWKLCEPFAFEARVVLSQNPYGPRGHLSQASYSPYSSAPRQALQYPLSHHFRVFDTDENRVSLTGRYAKSVRGVGDKNQRLPAASAL